MDGRDGIYEKNLHEQDLALAELCGNVAMNHSANRKQTDTAHALRMEWIRLSVDHSPGDGKKETEVIAEKANAGILIRRT